LVVGGFFLGKTTIKEIELRAPGVSTSNTMFLLGRVVSGVIFSGF